MKEVEGSKVYRLFYPVVPAVVAARHMGILGAMPVVSLVSLANDPPMVGFSSSPSHSTLKAVLASGMFSVSWLDRRYSGPIVELGSKTGAGARDKLTLVGLNHTRGKALGVPIVKESSASLECRVVASEEYGDHVFVVGRVERAEASEDFRDYWGFEGYKPTMYAGIEKPIGNFSPAAASKDLNRRR